MVPRSIELFMKKRLLFAESDCNGGALTLLRLYRNLTVMSFHNIVGDAHTQACAGRAFFCCKERL
jgi:hypothetical protein